MLNTRLDQAPTDVLAAAHGPLMVRCIHLLTPHLARPRSSLLRDCRPLTRFAAAIRCVCRLPHVSLTDRPRAWSCADHEAAVFELELASTSHSRRVQKERPQSIKVRARSATERMPSLAHGACTRAHTCLAAECKYATARCRRAPTLGGRGERGANVLLCSWQVAAVGVAPSAASRLRRSCVALVGISRMRRLLADDD